MTGSLLITFLLLCAIPLHSANVISNETQPSSLPPLHQVIAEFDQMFKKSGQHNDLVKFGKNLLGISTSGLDTDCNPDNIEEGLTQCDSLNTYLMCYTNRKCGCLDIDQFLEEFDGKLGELQAAVDSGVAILKELGVTLKTSYNETTRRCAGASGSLCPTGGIFSTQRLPDQQELRRSFNAMKCEEGLECSEIKGYEHLSAYVGQCSSSNLIPLSLGLLFVLASISSRLLHI